MASKNHFCSIQRHTDVNSCCQLVKLLKDKTLSTIPFCPLQRQMNSELTGKMFVSEFGELLKESSKMRGQPQNGQAKKVNFGDKLEGRKELIFSPTHERLENGSRIASRPPPTIPANRSTIYLKIPSEKVPEDHATFVFGLFLLISTAVLFMAFITRLTKPKKRIILPPQFSIFTEERRGHYCQQHCRSCLISENLENTRQENSVCFTIPRIRNAAHIPQDSNKHKKSHENLFLLLRRSFRQFTGCRQMKGNENRDPCVEHQEQQRTPRRLIRQQLPQKVNRHFRNLDEISSVYCNSMNVSMFSGRTDISNNTDTTTIDMQRTPILSGLIINDFPPPPPYEPVGYI